MGIRANGNSASALLFVVAMTGVITLVTLGWWRRASLLYDVVKTRELYYKNFYATDKVLFYGISVAKRSFVDLIKKVEKDTCVLLDCSEQCDSMEACGCCIFRKGGDRSSLLVQATLYKDTTIYCTLLCRLVCKSRDAKSSFFIKNYTIAQ